MAIGPGDTVEAPLLAPPAQGLLVAADVVDHTAGDERGMNGVGWSPELCGDGEVWAASCGTIGNAKGAGRNRPVNVAAEPFGVIARDSCSTFGWRAAEYEARARRKLAAIEGSLIEREFWSGVLLGTANRNLSEPTASIVGYGLGLRLALAALQQAIADGRAGLGMIHARPIVVMQWWSLNLLRWDQGKLRTALGTPVVAGMGYTGTGPNGEVPANGTEWAYATDSVVVERWAARVYPDAEDDRERIAQATDRASNLVEFRAERMAAVKWSACVHAAAEVNISIA